MTKGLRLPIPLPVVLSMIIAILRLGCGDPATAPEPVAVAQPPASHEDLVRHYAPVIRQGTASDQDYITAADLGNTLPASFDGEFSTE